MDSDSKDTANWHKAEDRGPDGLADWRGRAACGYKEKKGGQVFITLNEEKGSGVGVGGKKGSAWERHHGESRCQRDDTTRLSLSAALTCEAVVLFLYSLLSPHEARPQIAVELCMGRLCQDAHVCKQKLREDKNVPYQGDKENRLSGGRIKRKAAVSFLFPNFSFSVKYNFHHRTVLKITGSRSHIVGVSIKVTDCGRWGWAYK